MLGQTIINNLIINETTIKQIIVYKRQKNLWNS